MTKFFSGNWRISEPMKLWKRKRLEGTTSGSGWSSTRLQSKSKRLRMLLEM